jgi:hypothetical protein
VISYCGKSVVLVALLAVFAGCTGMSAARKSPFAGYPFRHADFDFIVTWKTSPVGKSVDVDGILKNVRYFQVTDLQLWVKALNKDKKVLADESTLFLPVPLNTDDYLPFSVTLKNVTLAPGDMLKFVILCRVNEDSKSSSIWLSSFTVDAITGAAIVKEGANSGD